MINHIIKIIFISLIILSVNLTGQQDSNRQVTDEEDTSAFVMQKSPWGAVLRSAVVPGLGQIYNESYWKAPVIWGIGAWLIYNWIQNDQDYKNYRKLFNQNQLENFRRVRTFYRDQRDLFSIYIALTYVLNLVDAYVDAHLFDFTVDENFFTGSPMLSIHINF